MAQHDAISFQPVGWREHPLNFAAKAEGILRFWDDDFGGRLSLHRFDLIPDLAAPLENLDVIRQQYRQDLAEQHGAIVEIDRVEISGLAALKTILKFQQKPHGMTYVGSYTIPFESFSFVIRVICPEIGTTGIRDACVFTKIGEITEEGFAPGWAQDPYDPKFEGPVLRNKSEDEEWDSKFPGHPLSRVRATLAQVADGCEVADELHKQRPFTGPRDLPPSN